MQLRPYQTKVLEDARNKLRAIKARSSKGPRLLIQCPTGGGKTVLASFITKSHLDNVPGGSVKFICHRDFLVDQTARTFARVGIDYSHVAAGRWYNQWSRTHVCMVQTVSGRIQRIKQPTLCIWDECHHLGAKTWSKIMDAWPDATHIGLSATPTRLDGKGLDGYFDDMVTGPSVAELIQLGALSDYTYYAPSAPDVSKFHTRMGDYVQAEVDAEMGRAVVIGDLVGHYAKLARGKKAVYFCTSIKNSKETTAAFNAAGFRFVHLDGDDSTFARKNAARQLALGELDGITNVNLFGEGFDLAAQAEMDVTVEVVGIARPTKSLGLSRQMIGRVLRPKDAPGIILDHAGHLKNFGLPDDEVEWSLKGAKRSQEVKYFHCTNCGAALHYHAVVCRSCGTAVEKDGPARKGGGGEREVEFIDGTLEAVDREAHRRAAKKEQGAARTLEQLVALGQARGYKRPEDWAAHLMTARMKRGVRL